MKTVKIKIHLPNEIIVNIPTLSEVKIDDVFECIGTEGKRLMNSVIENRVLEAFIKKHTKLIGRIVKELVDEHEDEILELLKLKKVGSKNKKK